MKEMGARVTLKLGLALPQNLGAWPICLNSVELERPFAPETSGTVWPHACLVRDGYKGCSASNKSSVVAEKNNSVNFLYPNI